MNKQIQPTDSDYIFKNLRIIQDPISGSWGVKDEIDNSIIIKCVFDYIKWIKEEDIIKFSLNGKNAICRYRDIHELGNSL